LALGACVLLPSVPASASSLRISLGSQRQPQNEVEADYTTSHVFIDEVSGTSAALTLFFDPQTFNVEQAEVFTNLNRRDRATQDANNDQIEDGIVPPDGNGIPAGNDANYYKAYPMNGVPGGYLLTLQATRCGAYRITARFRLTGDPPGAYRWYGDQLNPGGIRNRDHAVVVSPSKALGVQLYEVNPLSIVATGTQSNQRGTFGALTNGLPAGSAPQFNLSYVKSLGTNMLWMLPIHATGIDGRENDPLTGQPYAVGSPYAVKNFFSVMPLLASTFNAGENPQANDTSAGRSLAQAEFVKFVRAADQNGVDVMLDAPFNHAAHDLELGDFGQKYWGNAGSNPASEIRNVEARFFSRQNEYDLRASNAATVAPAPDRFDFGKWNDVFDIYFGRYAALVPNQSQQDAYRNEGDWFDYTTGNENTTGTGNGHFDTITQNVWRFFADYLQFWLTVTGYPENAAAAALNSSAGIDALRADFGQGLPPQCWEYLINRTRTRRWDFLFMAESLDGGPVTYRSARHFDILNESLIYDLHHALNTTQFRQVYDARRSAYGSALILLNTSSHDEDNYRDPFDGLLRSMINHAMPGVPMISGGQEIGLRGTIVPPQDSVPSAGPPFGYERYESGFFGKPIPLFKGFNSLMPLWQQFAAGAGQSVQIQRSYQAIGGARAKSPALRGSNIQYLNLQNNTPHGQIFSAARFQRRNANASTSDVVLAFININPRLAASTAQGNAFSLQIDADGDGVNDLGIQADRLYNVQNLAAFANAQSTTGLWPAPRNGSDLLANGIGVQLNAVPSDVAGWAQKPYEAQYLKLVDVTP
jgi:glycosidase